MNRVLSWAEFLVELKTEAEIQSLDANEDALLLALTNEALTQIVSIGKNLREFRLDITLPITDINEVSDETLFIAEIDQIYYRRFEAGVFQRRYDLIEQSGVVGPPPPSLLNPTVYTPSSYTIRTESRLSTNNKNIIVFYPVGSGQLTDFIQIIGSGFKHIALGGDLMYYFNVYPQIKAFVFERYAMKRNLDVNKVALMSKLVDRYSAIAVGSTADSANTENTNNK